MDTRGSDLTRQRMWRRGLVGGLARFISHLSARLISVIEQTPGPGTGKCDVTQGDAIDLLPMD